MWRKQWTTTHANNLPTNRGGRFAGRLVGKLRGRVVGEDRGHTNVHTNVTCATPPQDLIFSKFRILAGDPGRGWKNTP